eukprot:symbB.v1.2.031875.t1/scaffold3745.1/size85045/1
MRTPGGAKLTDREWKALQSTSVDGPQHAHKLANTEHFFEACYTWSVVSLAYAVRSFESAKASGTTLYATRAVDVVQNASRGQAAAVAEALLSHTNMNDTGRLPHFGLYHVGMEVRLTQTLAAPHVAVDCIGVIRGFTFGWEDEGRGERFLCCAAQIARGHLRSITGRGAEVFGYRTKWSVCGSSLQQQSCLDMRWLASYVALSRVRSLERLRSVGLDHRVREILEQGPPDTLPLRFRQLFAEKETLTRGFADRCLTALGW